MELRREKNLNFNVPFLISRKTNIFLWYFRYMIMEMIPFKIRKLGNIVDNVQTNFLCNLWES